MNSKIKKLIKKYIILPGYAIFRLLPVKNDLILFESDLGRNYGGNPKYIYEEMIRQRLDNKLKCIWIIEDTQIKIPGKAKKVKRSRLMYYYYIARAKIWIFDTRDPKYIRKREQGYYIQTWHGTPLKKLGMDMDDVFMAGNENIISYKCNFYQDSRKWDFVLSQNNFSTKIFKSAFAFSEKYSKFKEIWTYGYPRNDILTTHNNEEYINRLKDELNIPLNKKVLLYAPTWRDDQYHSQSRYKFSTALDFDKLKNKLHKYYVIIVKYHYLVWDNVDWSDYEGFIYTFKADYDITNLYLVSDMLITDYSSVMFDYSVLNRPMFFFMYDLESYRDELRGFYSNVVEEIPGPISKTTDELIKDILEYDNKLYKDKYKAFRDKYNEYDDGKASQRVINRILELKDTDKVVN